MRIFLDICFTTLQIPLLEAQTKAKGTAFYRTINFKSHCWKLKLGKVLFINVENGEL